MRPGDGQIAGAGEEIEAGDEEILRIFDLLAAELSARTAAELTAKIVGASIPCLHAHPFPQAYPKVTRKLVRGRHGDNERWG